MEDCKHVDELDLSELKGRLDELMELEPHCPDDVWLEMIKQDRSEIMFYISRIING